VIDDANDPCICRNLCRVERKAGLLASHEEDMFTDTSANRVHGDHGAPDVAAIGTDRLHDEQLDAFERRILPSSDDIANHSRNLHQMLRLNPP
jgi:hypothetical protein